MFISLAFSLLKAFHLTSAYTSSFAFGTSSFSTSLALSRGFSALRFSGTSVHSDAMLKNQRASTQGSEIEFVPLLNILVIFTTGYTH
jgi:hypothetical protein